MDHEAHGNRGGGGLLIYDFYLDDHVPDGHLLCYIDRFVDLESARTELKPFYSTTGRPSIDPDLMLRMLIVDVEAIRAIRQAEVGAARTMIARIQDRFGLWSERLAADSAYGSAENLAWLVHERGIEPHIPVFDKSERQDGTFSRSEFVYDHEADATSVRPASS